ncbi:MAG TPA: undecaprenyl-diphosphate phosphatase [Opitutaceae bacterium]|nr:undecaprenyl-diphosphate phosphatase [Opitutaceae bacterium]
MRKLFFTFLLFLAAAGARAANPAVQPVEVKDVAPAAELSFADAITLGVVEGVTEYLPISSTGHLIVVSRLLGLESQTPLLGRDGQPLWYKKPSAKYPQGVPLTLKLAADTYVVVIQFGAIAAVAILYWTQLMSMLRGLLGRDPAGLRLLINVMIAFTPAAVIGLLAGNWISENLFSVGAVIIAQVAGAFLMLFAEYWRRRRMVLVKHVPESSELTYRQVAGIGLLQCISMWPGTSRSMMTIVGGYFAGLDPRRAAEFSFLLGFVTLSAATVLKSYTTGGAMIQVFGWPPVLLGAVVAAVTAAVSVRFLVSWLAKHGLAAFALYRLGLAGVLVVLFYLWPA